MDRQRALNRLDTMALAVSFLFDGRAGTHELERVDKNTKHIPFAVARSLCPTFVSRHPKSWNPRNYPQHWHREGVHPRVRINWKGGSLGKTRGRLPSPVR